MTIIFYYYFWDFVTLYFLDLLQFGAYWITTFASFTWVYIDLSRQLSIDPSDPANSQSDITGILGLIIISSISAFEAVITVKRGRESLSKE